jgi:hypothetical protein
MVNAILSTDTPEPTSEGSAQPLVHHVPTDLSDRFALGFTKLLRFTADTFLPSVTGTGPSCLKRSPPCREWLERCLPI